MHEDALFFVKNKSLKILVAKIHLLKTKLKKNLKFYFLEKEILSFYTFFIFCNFLLKCIKLLESIMSLFCDESASSSTSLSLNNLRLFVLTRISFRLIISFMSSKSLNKIKFKFYELYKLKYST